MPRLKLLPWAAVVTIGLGSTAAQAAFDIRLNLDSVAPGYRSYFEAAESFWEGVITGYQPGIALSGLNIRAATFNGSPGGTLGFAGWTDGIRSQGYALATDGTMSFDLADVPGLVQNGQFAAVIQHEMAHVLGFGTLWTSNYNGVYQDGTGRYTGPAALAEYRREFSQPGAQWVPVELGGGAGTTRDCFELLSQAERFGARVALFGRKINLAEDPLAMVALMRHVADGSVTPAEAVKAYHNALGKGGITPTRSLADDSLVTEAVLKQAA